MFERALSEEMFRHGGALLLFGQRGDVRIREGYVRAANIAGICEQLAPLIPPTGRACGRPMTSSNGDPERSTRMVAYGFLDSCFRGNERTVHGTADRSGQSNL